MINFKLNKVGIAALTTTLAFSTIFSNTVLANDDQLERKKISLSVEAGIRKDNLDWKISGFDSYLINSSQTQYYQLPTSSELSWKNLDIFETKIGAEIPLTQIYNGNLFLTGSIAHGSIYGGENQDSDYWDIPGNRIEFSRSNNKSDSGSTADYSLAINYEVPVQRPIINDNFILNKITPAIGYAISKQNLRMTDGYQTLYVPGIFDGSDNYYLNPNVTTSYTGPISGLNSSYDTSWKGFFLGIATDVDIFERHNLKLSGKYHMNDYYAEADWNLRADFAHPKSFEHEADSEGIELALKYAYKATERLSLNLGINYKKFTTDQGTDTTFSSSGASYEVTLDEVNWDSASVLAGVNYTY